MKLLISIQNLNEALKIKDCNFDILDIKNPAEGSLGANYPGVIKSITEEIRGIPISAAGGDLPGESGTASLITYGLAHTGVDYIKLGLYGFKNKENAAKMLKEAVKAVNLSGRNIKLIAAAYADYQEAGTLSPFVLNEIAFETEIDGIMIDTLDKNDKNLFDFLDKEQLKEFVDQARKAGVLSALAGSLRSIHLKTLKQINPDIIGFRGAVCRGKDRSTEISPQKIDSLYEKINLISIVPK
jgi:hypothetical protein